MSEILPNFLVVGAAKSGTTSLYYYLIQHPEIGLSSKKEGKFFSQMPDKFNGPGDDLVKESITRTFEDYQKLYTHITDEKAIGDISPDYLYFHENSINNIKSYLGSEVKIIIILRNPADKTFSQYSHLVRDGRETLSFEQALEEEENRIEQGWEWTWHYKNSSLYYKQVKAYLDTFGNERVYIILNEELRYKPTDIIKDTFKFLKINEDFVPDMSMKWNSTKTFQSESFNRFITNHDHPLKKLFRPILLNTIGKNYTEALVNFFKDKNTSRMRKQTRAYLSAFYKNDIIMLQDLLKRDLSAWLK